MAFDPQLQRRIFGRFATGVTVVTTRYDDQYHGMTANAVTSLSLDPPLVLVAVDRRTGMHAALHKGQCFALNILNDTHEHLSRRFATSGPKEFADLSVTTAVTGAPDSDRAWAGSIAALPRCWPAAITIFLSAKSWPAATTKRAGRCCTSGESIANWPSRNEAAHCALRFPRAATSFLTTIFSAFPRKAAMSVDTQTIGSYVSAATIRNL